MVISELREKTVLILKRKGTIFGSFLLVNFIGLVAVILNGESGRHSFLPYQFCEKGVASFNLTIACRQPSWLACG